METNSIIIDLVARGRLHSILPYSATHMAYKRGEISIAPIKGISWPWTMASSRDRPTTAAMRVFVNLLLPIRINAWKVANGKLQNYPCQLICFYRNTGTFRQYSQNGRYSFIG